MGTCSSCGHAAHPWRLCNTVLDPAVPTFCRCAGERVDPSPPSTLEPDAGDDEGNPGAV